MKIAFATDDLVHINSHFGWAKQMAIYDVSPEGYKFLETIDFGDNLKQDGDEDKLNPKLIALADCTIVYVSDIGGSAAARLINKRITPIKSKSEDEEIHEILEKIVQTLQGNPPPWLRKALQQKTRNFDQEELTV